MTPRFRLAILISALPCGSILIRSPPPTGTPSSQSAMPTPPVASIFWRSALAETTTGASMCTIALAISGRCTPPTMARHRSTRGSISWRGTMPPPIQSTFKSTTARLTRRHGRRVCAMTPPRFGWGQWIAHPPSFLTARLIASGFGSAH